MWHIIKIPIRASWTSIINTLLQVTNNAVNKHMWYKFLSLSDIDCLRTRLPLSCCRESILNARKPRPIPPVIKAIDISVFLTHNLHSFIMFFA